MPCPRAFLWGWEPTLALASEPAAFLFPELAPSWLLTPTGPGLPALIFRAWLSLQPPTTLFSDHSEGATEPHPPPGP